jgi:hypothetical protein
VKERSVDRRGFLSGVWRLGVLALVVPGGAVAAVVPARSRHPDPRPDIDGSKVLAKDAVMPHVAELFDEIRRIPHLADGVACRCGCGEVPGMRSLLSCYEGVGMAQFCQICEGDGRLVARLSAEGKSLDEIRADIDRRG